MKSTIDIDQKDLKNREKKKLNIGLLIWLLIETLGVIIVSILAALMAHYLFMLDSAYNFEKGFVENFIYYGIMMFPVIAPIVMLMAWLIIKRKPKISLLISFIPVIHGLIWYIVYTSWVSSLMP